MLHLIYTVLNEGVKLHIMDLVRYILLCRAGCVILDLHDMQIVQVTKMFFLYMGLCLYSSIIPFFLVHFKLMNNLLLLKYENISVE